MSNSHPKHPSQLPESTTDLIELDGQNQPFGSYEVTHHSDISESESGHSSTEHIEDNRFLKLYRQVKSQSTRQYRARGILLERCLRCQLKISHCICSSRRSLNSAVDFVLLMHKDEIFKPTNTGRLIADCFTNNTFAFCWDRTKPHPDLIQILKDPKRDCFVIYPTEDQTRTIVQKTKITNDKVTTFIILDATWRQSRRMFNASLWLKNTPVLTLNPSQKARYLTRKAAHDNYLSTAESVAMALKSSGQSVSANHLLDYFDRFNLQYLAMKRAIPQSRNRDKMDGADHTPE